eukprot:scaffold3613_cov331-Prasinococcus_capsulatus_cf.AAC.2
MQPKRDAGECGPALKVPGDFMKWSTTYRGVCTYGQADNKQTKPDGRRDVQHAAHCVQNRPDSGSGRGRGRGATVVCSAPLSRSSSASAPPLPRGVPLRPRPGPACSLSATSQPSNQRARPVPACLGAPPDRQRADRLEPRALAPPPPHKGMMIMARMIGKLSRRHYHTASN